MFFLIVSSLLIGAVSVLTPCVLPLLPAVLATTPTGGGRRRPWGIVTGVVISFALAVLLLDQIISWLGLPTSTVRWISVVILVGFGLTLLIPPLERRFQAAMQVVVRHAPQANRSREGFGGGFLIGIGLGLVWTPCAGPLLAAVTANGASQVQLSHRIAIAVAYAVGLGIPLAIILVFGRKAVTRLMRATGGGSRVLPVMGVVMLATAFLVGGNYETKVNSWVSTHTGWSSTPLAGLQNHVLTKSKGGDSGALASSANAVASASTSDPVSDDDSNTQVKFTAAQLTKDGGYPATEVLRNYGPAPEFAGISNWYNTADGKPITQASLKGKVVIIDFWTYSCINCLRSIPHQEALYKKYAKDGLVIVGVHTPEFDFEKDADNVGRAVKQLGITYPVALDPDDTTWGKYFNEYWPADYLIDQKGNIRSVYYGEGDYDREEQLVRSLLGVTSGSLTQMANTAPTNQNITPETYFGYERAARGVSLPKGSTSPGVLPDAPSTYTLPKTIPASEWGFSGTWTDHSSEATAGADAAITVHYEANHVYMVLSPPSGGNGTATVTDGKTTKTIQVTNQQLYPIWDDTKAGEGQLKISLSSGVQAFTFTFG